MRLWFSGIDFYLEHLVVLNELYDLLSTVGIAPPFFKSINSLYRFIGPS